MEDTNGYIHSGGNSIRTSDLLTLINSMSSAMILVKLDIDDTAGNIICVNKSATKLIGKQARELLNESADSIFSRDGITLPMNKYNSTESSNPPSYLKKIVRENEEVVNVEVESTLVQVESGEQYLLYTLKDITEEMKLQKRLETSLKQFESLFQNNPDVTFSINPVGALTNINAAGARILEYSIQELIGMSFRDLIATEDVEITDNVNSTELKFGGNTATIFPNPFDDEINISFSKLVNFNSVSVSLKNSIGTLILENSDFVVQSDNRSLKAIGLTGLASGTYILNLSVGNKSDTAILIKN